MPDLLYWQHDAESKALMRRFAEKHRRLLNTLLRSNASLLQGSLAPLLKLPRLIEFDNKRSYFRTRIHATSDDHRRYGGLRIAVRRSHVFEDSFHQMRMRYMRCCYCDYMFIPRENNSLCCIQTRCSSQVSTTAWHLTAAIMQLHACLHASPASQHELCSNHTNIHLHCCFESKSSRE